MGSPANLTLAPQASTITTAIDTTTMNCVAAAEAGHRAADGMPKLVVYLRHLQEERGKIEAFQRELPLCMQLLDAAIETSKQRVMSCDQCSPTASLQTSVVDAQDSDTSKRTPVLENFMPLKRRWEKHTNDNNEDEDEDEQKQQKQVVVGRPAWMGEAQLWTKHSQRMDADVADVPATRRHMDFSSGMDQANSPLTNARLLLSSKHRQGGAFVPFTRERQLTSPPFSPPLTGAVNDAASLSLSTSAAPTASHNGHGNADSEDVRGCDHVSDARVNVDDYPAQTRPVGIQPQRKARRCWSPELHRRFVNALQQLGGSQVATPKQIRELMKVDGLTNDEVKSHLQKYRLHTRRSSPPPSDAPQLLILGWVPPPPAMGAASQASTGGVCDDPPAATALPQENTPPQSLQGASPHSSSDSYLDESDDEQEGKSTTTSSQKAEEREPQPLQSKGSTTCLPDIDTIRTGNRDRSSSAIGKLQTFRKAKAAA